MKVVNPEYYKQLTTPVQGTVVVVNVSVKWISIETIKDIICEVIGVPFQVISKRSRKRTVVLARHLLFYYARIYTQLSLGEIGRIAGKKDHTTVIHGRQKIIDYLQVADPFVCEFVEKINQRIAELKEQ